MTFQAIWYMVGSESPRKNGHWIQHKQADALAAFYLLDYFSAVIWIYRMKIFLHPSVLLVVMKVWVPQCFRYSPKSIQSSLSIVSLEPKFHELSAFYNLFCWILSVLDYKVTVGDQDQEGGMSSCLTSAGTSQFLPLCAGPRMILFGGGGRL